jgi:altronate dehydratase small subunit
MSLALHTHPNDNVVTMLEDSPAGSVSVLGDGAHGSVEILEPVARGHKVALVPIACGSVVLKFGVSIGTATTDIPAGSWVHTHNCASRFDARSSTLDRHTGAPTDTKYE